MTFINVFPNSFESLLSLFCCALLNDLQWQLFHNYKTVKVRHFTKEVTPVPCFELTSSNPNLHLILNLARGVDSLHGGSLLAHLKKPSNSARVALTETKTHVSQYTLVICSSRVVTSVQPYQKTPCVNIGLSLIQ